jgi:hypothetical protein
LAREGGGGLTEAQLSSSAQQRGLPPGSQIGGFTAQDARSEGRGSSAGSAVSGFASKARIVDQEYNDAAARVARLLQARHYTRFAREARVSRRLDELAIIAAGGTAVPPKPMPAPPKPHVLIS